MTRYAKLFDLQIEHDYYADDRCRGLAVDLEPASARKLAGRRGLLERRTDGADVLVEVIANERNRQTTLIEPAPGLTLGFELRVVDSELPWFTRLPSTRATPTEPSALVRVELRNCASTSGQFKYTDGKPSAGPTVLGRVEISGIVPCWLSAPPRFSVVLRPRKARWVYYVVYPRSHSSSSCAPRLPLEIVDESPQGEKIQFESLQLDTDRIAKDLAERYPNHQRLCTGLKTASRVRCLAPALDLEDGQDRARPVVTGPATSQPRIRRRRV